MKKTIIAAILICLIAAGCTKDAAQSYRIFYGRGIDRIETAKQFALDFSGEKKEKVSFELEEYDALKRVYKFKFGNSARSYRCEIDSETGLTIQYEFDGEPNFNRCSGGILGQSEVIAIIMRIDDSVDESGISMHVDKQNDDGLTVYEGEAYGSIYKYYFEIEAVSGAVVQWKTSALAS